MLRSETSCEIVTYPHTTIPTAAPASSVLAIAGRSERHTYPVTRSAGITVTATTTTFESRTRTNASVATIAAIARRRVGVVANHHQAASAATPVEMATDSDSTCVVQSAKRGCIAERRR